MVILKKKRFLAIGAIAALMACGPAFTEDSSKNQKEEQTLKADTNDIDMQKVSEAFGNFIGRNLKSNGIEFNLEGIIKGMRDGSADKPSPLTEQEYEKMMTKLQERAFASIAETNLKSATEFLTKNAHAEGVVEVIPGKLQYIILEKGHGPTVTENGTPLINYTGKYLDGTVFGSSEDAGGPITVPLGKTIPGFSKGIVGMQEGEKRRLFVHPDFGYGRAGHLPPNSLLIFEIEAIKAVSPEKLDSDSDSLGSDESDFEDDLDNLHDHEIAPTKAQK